MGKIIVVEDNLVYSRYVCNFWKKTDTGQSVPPIAPVPGNCF